MVGFFTTYHILTNRIIDSMENDMFNYCLVVLVSIAVATVIAACNSAPLMIGVWWGVGVGVTLCVSYIFGFINLLFEMLGAVIDCIGD